MHLFKCEKTNKSIRRQELYKDKKIAVVVPAYNEEKMIVKVVETMPDFVDHIVIVDDCSNDQTVNIVKKLAREHSRHIVLIEHKVNQGVGGAIATGYLWARDNRIDVTAVMAGDGQMNPDELDRVILPVVEDRADYSKGNRLFTGMAWQKIPRKRYLGNAVLSLLTKPASGYWHVADSQCGYTAIGLNALELLEIEKIFPSYGMPNDLLVKLNVIEMRVTDVPVEPVYNIGERSDLKIRKVIFTISALLVRLFFWRMKERYVIRDFHPLVFFYLFAFVLIPLGITSGLSVLYFNTPIFGYSGDPLEVGHMILCAMFLLTGFQFLFFAMWFDMDYNKYLYVFHRRKSDK